MGAYEVKCDDCKSVIRRTDSLQESAAGGRCADCRPEMFTLVEFDAESMESAVYDVNDQLLVLRAIKAEDASDGVEMSPWDNAVEAARFVLSGEREGGMKPFVGILCHDHDPSLDDDQLDDPQSWAAGWVTADGEAHHGDYENDPGLWPAPESDRIILVHLNVTVPAGDARPVDEIVAALRGALEVGADDDAVRDLELDVALAEEIA